MKKLQKQISHKLDKLSKLLDNVIAAQVIDSNDSDTWDSDTLYSLVEDLKAALVLLEDQKTSQHDQYGEIITEPGLCSLIDDWENPEDE
jgi:hypothetical protein